MNSQGKNPIDVNKMIDRLKEEEGVTNDGDFADIIGMKPSTLSMARKRNSINLIQIIKYFEDYSADWIFYGIKPKLRKDKKYDAFVEEKGDHYGSEMDMLTHIRDLPVNNEKKLEILRTYIELLDQSKTDN